MWGNYYPMMGGWWGASMGIFSLIFGILIIIIVISLIRAIVGRGRCCGSHHQMFNGGDSALDILKERYAKGEINKEEFEQKMKDLKSY